MKTLLIVLAAFALAGCSTVTKTAIDTAAEVQSVLSAVLPPTFTGDYHAEETNMYFDYKIDVQGISKVDDRWVFTYFSFNGNGHFPLTPGLSWTGNHNITLGKKAP